MQKGRNATPDSLISGHCTQAFQPYHQRTEDGGVRKVEAVEGQGWIL
ncbi:MAG: hypothetical protein K9J37_22395 [Saprospiraceae bacterium]|nr:hypothetical protein [Saprospiraceae bacterium]MCF8252674.1 hypothetical protein [Saprospiraceae bacterium]MCF8282873.1 hypothetical protein [Bacteroidales bacterium]MCF8314246.1 hypothetical protein [Saprospiraceae bacterium]MCF8443062.1 hypothetical protein [Saprospiraceae bacterium]